MRTNTNARSIGGSVGGGGDGDGSIGVGVVVVVAEWVAAKV